MAAGPGPGRACQVDVEIPRRHADFGGHHPRCFPGQGRPLNEFEWYSAGRQWARPPMQEHQFYRAGRLLRRLHLARSWRVRPSTASGSQRSCATGRFYARTFNEVTASKKANGLMGPTGVEQSPKATGSADHL